MSISIIKLTEAKTSIDIVPKKIRLKFVKNVYKSIALIILLFNQQCQIQILHEGVRKFRMLPTIIERIINFFWQELGPLQKEEQLERR